MTIDQKIKNEKLKDNLNYKSKREKTYNFGKYSLHEEHVSLEDVNNKRSNFATELKN